MLERIAAAGLSVALAVAVAVAGCGGHDDRGVQLVEGGTGDAVRLTGDGRALTSPSSSLLVVWDGDEARAWSADGRRELARSAVRTEPSTDGTSAVALHGDQLAFVTRAGGRLPARALVVQRVDGTRTRIVDRPVGRGGPVFSPDGRQLALGRRVHDLRRGTERRLRTPVVVRHWLPDGRFVGTVRREGQRGTEAAHRLVVVRDGRAPRTLVEQFPGGSTAVSPDGRSIVVERPEPPYDSPGRTAVISLRTLRHRDLPQDGFWSAWSPDGLRIANTYGNGNVVVTRLTDRTVRTLKRFGDASTGLLGWTPDGRSVVVTVSEPAAD